MRGKTWNEADQAKALQLKATGTTAREIAETLGRTRKSVERFFQYRNSKKVSPKNPEPKNHEALARKAISKGSLSFKDLRAMLDLSPEQADELISLIGAEISAGGLVRFPDLQRGKISLDVLGDKPIRIGLVADTHLGSSTAREDILHLAYDHFEREGITKVFHAGNIVDGYIPRINGAETIVTSIDDQAQYVIDNYPQKKGIKTYYITGDDHEGWWQKEGFNFGAYLEMLAERQGRKDLRYLGHVEADVELLNARTKKGCIMKVQHPGGGASYAKSYHQQKQAESLQGGEKPAILIQGHHHVYNKTIDRNIHMLQIPGMQDQTVFGRKKRLRFEVGFVILEIYLAPDGAVARLKEECVMSFDRGYYKRYLRSDAKLAKKVSICSGRS
jgi:hypothetical protein